MKKKVFILLPDGIGLRNFAYTSFYEKLSNEFEVVFWNNTNFPLKEKLGIEEVEVYDKGRIHFMSDLLKRAKNRIELKLNSKKFDDEVYLTYVFHNKSKDIKSFIKNRTVDLWCLFYNSDKGVQKINKLIDKFERKTTLYRESKKQLINFKPDIIFCTNQRHTSTIAPMLAAKDLDIPTASFIFSWDNLPKATLVLNPDYYFVWSDYMKDELIKYYPKIEESQIKVTGTPQFEPHFDETLDVSKEVFFKQHQLDIDKDYICFSGDDITTSPFDQYYLEDLASSVRKLNSQGFNLGIIYRKNPTDTSTRYDRILTEYEDIISSIKPDWKSLGENWSSIMPMKGDGELLKNTVKYSKLVVNIASSMVFDAFTQNVPCAYLNYNPSKGNTSKWNVHRIYKFIHFRSMPSDKAVIWINGENDYDNVIKGILENGFTLDEASKWFQRINTHPKDSPEKMITFIHEVIKE
tara:strand:+ start:35007 stop:36398 length:1392 start_codon:yes stop_codon:yes gene_type:complete